jgi:hypothetical protein
MASVENRSSPRSKDENTLEKYKEQRVDMEKFLQKNGEYEP